MIPYICEGTVVQTLNKQIGKVIGVSRKAECAVVQINKRIFSEDLKNLTVLSYKEVDCYENYR